MAVFTGRLQALNAAVLWRMECAWRLNVQLATLQSTRQVERVVVGVHCNAVDLWLDLANVHVKCIFAAWCPAVP